MRMSDWSSDVCSSDLIVVAEAGGMAGGPVRVEAIHLADVVIAGKLVQQGDIIGLALVADFLEMGEVGRVAVAETAPQFAAAGAQQVVEAGLLPFVRRLTVAGRAVFDLPQIGRASCRERVWQYV